MKLCLNVREPGELLRNKSQPLRVPEISNVVEYYSTKTNP